MTLQGQAFWGSIVLTPSQRDDGRVIYLSPSGLELMSLATFFDMKRWWQARGGASEPAILQWPAYWKENSSCIPSITAGSETVKMEFSEQISIPT